MFDEQLKVCINQKQATVVALNLLILLKKKKRQLFLQRLVFVFTSDIPTQVP